MKQKDKYIRPLMGIGSVLYTVIMLILLYGKGIRSHASRVMQSREIGYWVTVRRYTNFEPLKTILPFVRMMRWFALPDILTSQTVGNILIFIPCGIFLPYFLKKQRHFGSFFRTCLLLILFIEISQVLTFLGSFDIDDVILNMIGCLLGYLLYSTCAGIMRCSRKAKKKRKA